MDEQQQDIVPAGSKIDLPYTVDPNTGAPVTFVTQQDMTSGDLQSFVNANFPRTLGSLALQAGTVGGDPVTREEFDLLKERGMNPFIQKSRAEAKAGMSIYGNAIKHAVKGVAEGAYEILKSTGDVLPPAMAGLEGEYNPGLAAAKMVEGFAQGNEGMWNAGKLGLNALFSKVGLVDEYDRYKLLRGIEATENQRRAGIPSVLGEEYAAQNPELMDSASKISNVLDFTVLVPGVGQALGLESKIGKYAAKVMGGVGKAMEAPANLAAKVINLSNEVKAGTAATAVGAAALGAAAASQNEKLATALGTGAVVTASLVGGRFLRHTAEILGSKEAASKIIQEGIEQSTGPLSRNILRALGQVPDSAYRVTRSAFDSTLEAGLLGASMGYTRASSDPYNTGSDIAQQTISSALAGGAVGGLIGTAIGTGVEVTGIAQKRAWAKEFADDISSRPESATATINGKEFEIPGEKQNRESVAVAPDLSEKDKAMIFGVLNSSELNGANVVFVNDNTPLPPEVGGSGAGMGAGVHILNNEGAKTIFINADRITAPTALEEVTHAIISDAHGQDAINNLVKQAGSIDAAIEVVRPYAELYMTETRQVDPARALEMATEFSKAYDPSLSPEERLAAASTMASEYIARGVAEHLSTARPEQLMTGRGGNIIENQLNKIFTAINTNSSGAVRDPLSGHFWKDGKLVDNPMLKTMSDNILTSIHAGKPLEGTVLGDKTPTGGTVVGVSGDISPRYDDINRKTGKENVTAEKKKINADLLNRMSDKFTPKLVTQEMVDSGVLSGNVKSTGKPVIYETNLSKADIDYLYSLEANGQRILDPARREAVERTISALNNGHLLNIVYDVEVKKSDRTSAYAKHQEAQIVRPIAFQKTEGSGPTLAVMNFSLLHELAQFAQKGSVGKQITKAMSDFGIKSVTDWIPVVEGYYNNLNKGAGFAMPSADYLASIAPKGTSKESAAVIRDVIHLASSNPRKTERYKNEPVAPTLGTPAQPVVEAYTTLGEKIHTTMPHDRNALNHIRLDAIHDASLFQPNGIPVKVELNIASANPLLRVNFAPGASRRERVGDKSVLVDPISQDKIVTGSDGRSVLFQAGNKSRKFDSEAEAIAFTNKPQFAPGRRRDYAVYAETKAVDEVKRFQAAQNKANRDNIAYMQGLQAARKEDRARMREIQRLHKGAAEFQANPQVEQALQEAERATARQSRKKAPSAVLEAQAMTSVPEGAPVRLGKEKVSPSVSKSFADLYSKDFPKGKGPDVIAPRPRPVDLLTKTQEQIAAEKADLQSRQQKRKERTAITTASSRELATTPDLSLATQERSLVAIGKKAGVDYILGLKSANPKEKLWQDVKRLTDSIPANKEPEPAKSGSSEIPETQIPGVSTAADDARVPVGMAIRISPNRKFSVYTVGRNAVEAVADTYREALMLTQKKRQQRLKKK